MSKFALLFVFCCLTVIGAESIEVDREGPEFVVTIRIDGNPLIAAVKAEKDKIKEAEDAANAETDPTKKAEKLAVVAAQKIQLKQQTLNGVLALTIERLAKSRNAVSLSDSEIDSQAVEAKNRIDAEKEKLKATRPTNKLAD